MANKVIKEPIPWHIEDSSIFTSWIWETDHFVLTIFGEGSEKKVFNWKIAEKSSGRPLVFDEGSGVSFKDCVDQSVEIIAKSWDRKLGYQKYAGDLATTFVIADGRKIDFSSLVGTTVTVTAKDSEGSHTILTGALDTHFYDIAISTDNTTLTIIPSRKIIDVKQEFGSVSAIDSLEVKGLGSANKTVTRQAWVPGCTGKPGYHPGTTIHQHDDPYCSIHKV